MANHKSAEKATRKAVYRTQINKSRCSRIHTFIRKAEEALSLSSLPSDISQIVVNAEREIMRGVSKGVLHKNTAARRVSKLTKKLFAVQNKA